MENKSQSDIENKINEIVIRAVSGSVLGFLAILCLVSSSLSAFILIFAGFMIAAYEYTKNCGQLKFDIDAMAFMLFGSVTLLAFFMHKITFGLIAYFLGVYIVYLLCNESVKKYQDQIVPGHLNRNNFFILGYLYIVLAFSSFAYIRSLEYGLLYSLWVVTTVAMADIFAYFSGMMYGHKTKKIMPKVSPNKTYAGLYGAIAASSITSYIFSSIMGADNIYALIIGGLLGVISQAGDFLESGFKRHIGVKDTGKIIPGHGGVLDRTDGLMAASIFVCICTLILGHNILISA